MKILTHYAGGIMDDRTKDAIRAYLHPDQAAQRMAVVVPEPAGDLFAEYGAEPTEMISPDPAFRARALPIRQMQAPAPFTGSNYLVYRWYVAVDPDVPDVPLVSGESFLQDCGPTWMVTKTVPLR